MSDARGKLSRGEALTLDDVIQALNDERVIKPHQVHPSTMRAKIWQGMVSLSGGYMPHAYSYARTARDAADGISYDLPKRLQGTLRRQHIVWHGGNTYEVSESWVSDLIR